MKRSVVRTREVFPTKLYAVSAVTDNATLLLNRLGQIDHAFVVNMRYAFQDDENCFFVLDLMLGGDLRCEPNEHLPGSSNLLTQCFRLPVHLDRLGSLPEPAVKVVIAEIASALAFIHDKRIIHR